MMNRNENTTREPSPIEILGGGVTGFALATFLKNENIDCAILERRDRQYIELRQHAWVVDTRAVRIFEQWELAKKLLSGPVTQTVEYRLNGVSRVFTAASDDGISSRFWSSLPEYSD